MSSIDIVVSDSPESNSFTACAVLLIYYTITERLDARPGVTVPLLPLYRYDMTTKCNLHAEI
jgi:hypothetical protein